MAPALSNDILALGTSGGSSYPTTNVKTADLDHFQDLVSNLSRILGPSSGLNSEDVDVKHLQELMENYLSREREWTKYAFVDLSRGYTRNLVDEGNGKSNLLVLVWSPGKGSPIHDHADAHCLMKILKGSLRETRYQHPSVAGAGPQEIKITTYAAGEVTYMADELGLHKISNPDPEKLAVSLHLYTPPNAARQGCNIFCEKTGRSSHVTQSNFYSISGRKAGL